ncbi:MAG: hypothetical protein KDI52_09740, partial [Xanthomonadales bacterium]|nr:hypothetical protein [Xanthomonadales bacterium]
LKTKNDGKITIKKIICHIFFRKLEFFMLGINFSNAKFCQYLQICCELTNNVIFMSNKKPQLQL